MKGLATDHYGDGLVSTRTLGRRFSGTDEVYFCWDVAQIVSLFVSRFTSLDIGSVVGPGTGRTAKVGGAPQVKGSPRDPITLFGIIFLWTPVYLGRAEARSESIYRVRSESAVRSFRQPVHLGRTVIM